MDVCVHLDLSTASADASSAISPPIERMPFKTVHYTPYLSRPALFHRYFFPAASTLPLNTGFPTATPGPPNGLITLLSQHSNTSTKNRRIASSVAGLVGLFAILPPPLTLAIEDREDTVAEEDEAREGVVSVPGKEFV